MRKVLHLIDTTGPGGAETVFLELIKATIKSGDYAVAVIRGAGWVEEQLESIGCEYHVIDCKGSFNIRFLWALVRIIRSNKISLVQTHLFGSAIYGSLASWLTRTPAICTLHGMVDIGDNERFLGLKRKAIALGASKIITVTDQLYSKVQDLEIIAPEKLLTIYNGIDTSIFVNKGKAGYRHKLGLSEEDIVIGSLGNIRTPKNYPLAIDAITELHNAGCKAHYVIAGQGNDKQMAPLHKKIAESNLQNYVHLLGFVADTPEYLSCLDVFLMSSSSEGHPLAITQAMAIGVPVVSTPSGVEEVAVPDIEIILTKEHDPVMLANAVLDVYQNKELSERLVIKAKSKANAMYSVHAMTGSYSSIYRSLMGNMDT